MRIIGITGGIGSGKTTVSKYIKNLGYDVIDADQIAHDLADDEKVLAEIVDMFGSEVLNSDGKLDRKLMAQIVFSDLRKKEMLETIITDRVVKECADRIEKYRNGELSSKNNTVFLDAPLLFETGADRFVDEVWMVKCDMRKRLERAELRDDTSAEEIEARIASQIPESDITERSDEVILNDGTVDELYAKIDTLL